MFCEKPRLSVKEKRDVNIKKKLETKTGTIKFALKIVTWIHDFTKLISCFCPLKST